jgi:hypothetical protein
LIKYRTVLNENRTDLRAFSGNLILPLTPSADLFVTAVFTAIDRAFCAVDGTAVGPRTDALPGHRFPNLPTSHKSNETSRISHISKLAVPIRADLCEICDRARPVSVSHFAPWS